MKKDELSGFLKVIGTLLSEMTDEEYQSMLKGQGKLSYSFASKTNKIKEGFREEAMDINMIANKLVEFDGREEAAMYLAQTSILKADLIRLSAELDIFINKSDSKERIIEKIVEATVGVKMRSKAIQDTQLKQSNKNERGFKKISEEGER